MLVGESAQTREVAVGGRIHAARALHRLGHDRGHTVAVFGHHLGHRLEIIGREHLHVGDEGPEALLVRGESLRGESAVGDAVIRTTPAQDQCALGSAGADVRNAASFIAESTASEPEDVRKTRGSGIGASEAMRSETASAGSFENGSKQWNAAIWPISATTASLISARP